MGWAEDEAPGWWHQNILKGEGRGIGHKFGVKTSLGFNRLGKSFLSYRKLREFLIYNQLIK